MTKEKQEPEENDINPEREYSSPSEEYQAISAAMPAREVELPEQAAGEPKTLTESMDDATDLTDLQFAMAKLFPKPVRIDDLMIGRIAPEAFLSLLGLQVTNEVMAADPRKPINTTEAITRNYVRLTVGLDGEGRIDAAKLVGVAKEIKQQEGLLKGI